MKKNLIDRIIYYLKNNEEIDENQEAILRFSIEVVISFIVSLGSALLMALFLGIFPNVFLIMLTTSILRSFSGGAHSETMFGCAVYGTIIMNGLGLLTKYTQPSKGFLSIFILFVILFSTWSINKYAPADTPGKPITTKVKRQKLKRLSFATLFIWYTLCFLWYTGLVENLTMVYTTTLGVLWQSFSLTKWGYALLHHMDRVFRMINTKKEELI